MLSQKIKIAKLYFYIALALSIFVGLLKITGPIIDSYCFRQTQTAISVFWMLKEGYSFPYITPVLGWPWFMPLEFPTYHTLVYGLMQIFPIENLDLAGRIVSIFFYYACFFPLHSILKHLKLNQFEILTSYIVILTTPLYIFWSRTFMIESTALFFTVSFLWAVLRYEKSERLLNLNLLWILLLGSLAILTKITTFTAALSFLFFYILILRGYKEFYSKKNLVVYFVILAVLGIGYSWVAYTDFVKSQNLFDLSSTDFKSWAFGNLSMRLDSKTYVLLYDKMMGDFGHFVFLIFFARQIGPIIKNNKVIWVLLFSFTAVFLTLIGVYANHHYYWFANSLYLCTAVGIILAHLMARFTTNRSLHISFIVIILLSLGAYNSYFRKLQTTDYSKDKFLNLSTLIRENTRDSDILYVSGMNFESTVPYFSERKAIAWPMKTIHEAGVEGLEKVLQKSVDSRLGALLFCDSIFSASGDVEQDRIEKLKYIDFPVQEYTEKGCKLYIRTDT